MSQFISRCVIGMICVFLLSCCGYQAYHEWIAKDLYSNKSFVILDKNIVGNQYGENVYNMRLQDMQGKIVNNTVTLEVYYDNAINSNVVLYVISDNIDYIFIKIAYLTYFLIGFGLIFLFCLWLLCSL